MPNIKPLKDRLLVRRIEEQEQKIATLSGKPPRAIDRIVRSAR